MGFIVDLHVHTVASGHAYSTLMDYVHHAKEHQINAIGFSDHGPMMPGASHLFHIANQRVIPRVIDDVLIFKGAEANIVNYDGDIDIPTAVLETLDYCIVSLHPVVIAPGTKEENTRAIINAIQHPNARLIGHLGNPAYPIDLQAVVEACKQTKTAIEINNSTFKEGVRDGSEDNCSQIARLAYDAGVDLVLSSDSHIHLDLAEFTACFDLLDRMEIPRDYPINYRRDTFYEWIGYTPEVW